MRLFFGPAVWQFLKKAPAWAAHIPHIWKYPPPPPPGSWPVMDWRHIQGESRHIQGESRHIQGCHVTVISLHHAVPSLEIFRWVDKWVQKRKLGEGAPIPMCCDIFKSRFSFGRHRQNLGESTPSPGDATCHGNQGKVDKHRPHEPTVYIGYDGFDFNKMSFLI